MMMDNPAGIVNILKPPGMTSSNVVTDVRRLFMVKRVGHTGTLDPGAAGVLPVCIGKATQLFDILVDKEKEYIAEIAFGAKTDTQDSYGQIIARSDAAVDASTLVAALQTFKGTILQRVPAYSAVKSDGKALYTLARSGQPVPERVREATIYALDYIANSGLCRHLLRVRCSRGTYVRTLCEDIGDALGVCAHMSFLLRSRTGMFTVEDSYSIAELEEMKAQGKLFDALTGIETVLSDLPAIHLAADDAQKLRHGRTVGGEELKAGQLYRVYGEEFLGIGSVQEEGLKLKLHV